MARFKKRTYKVRCDRSGFLVNSDQCRKQWDGLFVRKEDWEPRHPQDYLPSTRENAVPSDPRPEGAESFIATGSVTAEDL